MKLVVLALMLLFALGFFVLAAIMREDKRFGYALLSGFFMILISGLLVAGFGLEYKSGEQSHHVTDGIYDINYIYTSVTALERTVVSLPLILAGLWGLIVSVQGMRQENYEKDED